MRKSIDNSSSKTTKIGNLKYFWINVALAALSFILSVTTYAVAMYIKSQSVLTLALDLTIGSAALTVISAIRLGFIRNAVLNEKHSNPEKETK